MPSYHHGGEFSHVGELGVLDEKSLRVGDTAEPTVCSNEEGVLVTPYPARYMAHLDSEGEDI